MMVTDYAQHFSLGDIITIDNTDAPTWTHGRWRVLALKPQRVELEPVLSDGSIDTSRYTAAIVGHATGISGIVESDPRPTAAQPPKKGSKR